MSWKQKRVKDLNDRLLMIVGLLNEYEKNSDLEKEPTEKQKCRNKIRELKHDIETINDEIKEIGSLSASQGEGSSLETLETIDEHIYEGLSEEVKAVVEELQQRLDRAKGKTFTFLLIGRTGVGKSSTANSLMGAYVAPVNHFDPCTIDVHTYETKLNEVIVRVIDTPGLCDSADTNNDDMYIELIRQKIPYSIDAVLFVSQLDATRVDRSEITGLRLITEAFGELFWKKSVIVFTRSDKVSDSLFEEYVRERTKRIRAVLSSLQLSENTVDKIPSVAVDNTNVEKINPDGQKWIQQLYLTVLDRTENSHKDVFVLSTSHMLEKVGVAPLHIGEKIGVGGIAVNSGMFGALIAHSLGVGAATLGPMSPLAGAAGVPAGLFLFSNPVGWGIVLGSTVIGGGLAYKMIKNTPGR